VQPLLISGKAVSWVGGGMGLWGFFGQSFVVQEALRAWYIRLVWTLGPEGELDRKLESTERQVGRGNTLLFDRYCHVNRVAIIPFSL
jgi:hypothetical protein